MMPEDKPLQRSGRRGIVVPALVGGYLTLVTLFLVFVLHLSVSPERLLIVMLIAALVLGRAKLFLADWIRSSSSSSVMSTCGASAARRG